MDDEEVQALASIAAKGEKKKRSPVVRVPDGFGIVRDRDGRPLPCQFNAETLLEQRLVVLEKQIRFDKFKALHTVGEDPVSEEHFLEATRWLQQQHNTKFSKSMASDAIKAIGYRHKYDSLEDHVNACKWDGTPRLDTMASVYLGAEPTPLQHAILRCFVMGMAARALLPASYLRLVPILEGAQDVGKSYFFSIMGGPFFAPLQAQMGTKEASEQVIGAWVLEIPELAGMSKSEVTSIKAFITQNTDRFRAAYAPTVVANPRRSVLGGTTNQTQYLRDETGDTRFGPVTITKMEADKLFADRAQLIGEAAHRVRAGESWLLPDALKSDAAVATKERFERDPWLDRLETYLDGRDRPTTITECLTSLLGVDPARQDQRAANRVARALAFLGWVQVATRVNGKKVRAYRKSAIDLTGDQSQSKDNP